MSAPARNDAETMAAFMERLSAWYATPDGQAHEAQLAARRAHDARNERLSRQRELIRQAEIPNRYVRQFHDRKPEMTEGVQALALARTLLVMAGNVGCGKTTAAAWWLMEYILAPTTPYRPPRFITAGALSRGSKFDDARMSGLSRAPRLVIDDMGHEYVDDKGFFASVLDELIDARYSHDRPTVMTTNLGVEDFRRRYGERIADRIREAGEFVELSNASMRVRTA